jgi:squalene synthase HpnC
MLPASMTKNDAIAADVGALIAENTENFPVGSRLIPRDCRPHVMAFYLFARSADDVADSATLSAEEKISQLRIVQSALGEDEAALPDWALPYHRSLVSSGKTPKYGRDLLTAFIQDATKDRYADWDELMDYCLHSAATVGRVMLDIHGEEDADFEGSDALCNALQVLNHLQDCKKDYQALGRVYLPEPWLQAEGGGIEDLSADKASPAVRRVLDRCLDGTDALLQRAERMPPSVRRRGLRWESAIILQLARALSARLRVEDPVAGRVKVSKVGWLWCSTKGILRTW